jgi:hypothetical protein
MRIKRPGLGKDLGPYDLSLLLAWGIGNLLDRSEGVNSHAGTYNKIAMMSRYIRQFVAGDSNSN